MGTLLEPSPSNNACTCEYLNRNTWFMVFFPSPDTFHRLWNLLKIQRSLYNSLETFQKGEIVTKKIPLDSEMK